MKDTRCKICTILKNNFKGFKASFSRFIDKHYTKTIELESPDSNLKLQPLSPSNLGDSEQNNYKAYVDGLFFGICHRDIKNLALMGSYGTGKSSIIKTLKFDKKDKLPVHITVSLANFEGDNGEISGEQISLNIVNQILYSKNKRDISESRFKRIEHLSMNNKILSSITILLFVCSFIYLFLPDINKEIAIFPSFSFTTLLLKIIFFVGLFFLVWKSIVFLKNLRISKVSATSVEIDSKAETENINALDKYFDEILYFFQATNTKVMFIEDLDRFANSLQVFTKLRELNFLLNQSEDLDGNITFVYAVKDDMISNHNNRTKFFDLIISIVPYINYSNSREIFKKKIFEVDPILGASEEVIDLVNLVSKYIEDTRTVLTIVNDYLVMSQSLGILTEEDVVTEDGVVTENGVVTEEGTIAKEVINKRIKFLAFVIYKTLYPQDYSRLLNRDGVLYTFFSNKPKLLDKINETNKKNLDGVKSELFTLKSSKENALTDLFQLRRIFINGLLELFDYNEETVKQNLQVHSLNELLDETVFYDKFLTKKIRYYDPKSYSNKELNHSVIENLVKINYHQRSKQILLLDEIKEKEEQVRKIQELIDKCEISTIEDLYFANKDIIGQHLTKIQLSFKPSELKNDSLYLNSYNVLELLLEEGYINENFIRYVSYNHGEEGILSISDYTFLDKFENNLNDFTYEVSNPKVLLQDLAKHNFKQNTVLNSSLLKEIYGGKKKQYNGHKFALMQAFNNYFHTISDEFWTVKFKYTKDLVEDFISYAIFNNLLNHKELGEDHKVLLLNALVDCLKVTSGKLKEDSVFKEIIFNKENNYLDKISDDLFEKFVTELYYAIDQCDLIKSKKKLEILLDYRSYTFNIPNVDYLIKTLDRILDGYVAYSLTNILTNPENQLVKEHYQKQDIGNISDNIYLQNYIDRLKQNDEEIKESEEIVINHLFKPKEGELTDHQLDIVCNKVDFKIKDITLLNWRNSFRLLLINNRLEFSWTNLEDYYKRSSLKEFDESLNVFIEKHLGFGIMISGFDTLNNEDFKYALVNSDIDNTIILNILNTSNFKLKDVSKIVMIDKNLIKNIIKIQRFEFSDEIFQLLDDEQKLLYLLYYIKSEDSIIALNLDSEEVVGILTAIINNKYDIDQFISFEQKALVYKLFTEYLINHKATDINFSDESTVVNILMAIKDNLDIDNILEDQYDHLLNFIPNSGISGNIIKEFIAFFMSKTSKEKVIEYSKADIIIAFSYLELLTNTDEVDLIQSIINSIVDNNLDKILSSAQIEQLIEVTSKCLLEKDILSSDDVKHFLKVQSEVEELSLKLKVDLLMSFEKYLDDSDLFDCLEIFELPIADIEKKENFSIEYSEIVEKLLNDLSRRLEIQSVVLNKSESDKEFLNVVFFAEEDNDI